MPSPASRRCRPLPCSPPRAGSPRRTSGARRGSPPDESKAPSLSLPLPLVLGSVGVCVCRAVLRDQPASRRRASSSRPATVPSMTSSPISTRTPPITSGSTTSLRWISRPYCVRERLLQPVALGVRERLGHPDGRHALTRGVGHHAAVDLERRGERAVGAGERLLRQGDRRRQHLVAEHRADQARPGRRRCGPGWRARRAAPGWRPAAARRRTARRRAGRPWRRWNGRSRPR